MFLEIGKKKKTTIGTHAVREIQIKPCEIATFFVIYRGLVTLYFNGELILCSQRNNVDLCNDASWDIARLRESQMLYRNATVVVGPAQMNSNGTQVGIN